MSNWKFAYGWSGHILTSKDEHDGNQDDNVVAIPNDVFEKIVRHYRDYELDQRIHAEQLGVMNEYKVYFLATGTSFSEGFQYFGTVFDGAEWRTAYGRPNIDLDSEYLKAMNEIYGLYLPPCRLMVGCKSEH